MKFNTRIAPSPSGDMHIGTARTAYFNWLAARATGGKFLLRIDDTNKDLSKKEYIEVIVETMRWLGLDWDAYSLQSHRLDRYKEALATNTNMFRHLMIKEGAFMFNMFDRKDLPDHWVDDIAGTVPITDNDLNDMQDMVMIKSDGTAAYNWASVVDDMDFGINYIIRGTDHITNTSKQIILWHLLGAPIQRLAHVGLISHNRKKLSKREGAASMLHYREAGYDADAMLNFLARLGWGPKVDDKTTKTLPRERMLELFLTEGNLRNSVANMDLDKLEAYDRKYKAQKKVWRTRERLMD